LHGLRWLYPSKSLKNNDSAKVTGRLIARADGRADVIRLAGFLGDDDLDKCKLNLEGRRVRRGLRVGAVLAFSLRRDCRILTAKAGGLLSFPYLVEKGHVGR
jgi:hypothetical protein